MRTPIRLGAYAAGLAALFAAALAAGQLAGPTRPTAKPAAEHGHAATAGHDETANSVPAGLQVAQDGYRLALLSPTLATGAPQPFRFRIIGPDAAPVTRYATVHDKDLHLIVVRRDLTGFQHVHPTLSADGTWSIPLAAPAAGQYRVFADFRPANRAEGITLGADIPAPGDYRPVRLPAASRTATVDGYTVTLTGDLIPGKASPLTLSVSKDGKPVSDLQPYLGAYGHLVVLRDADLAYLHVHPGGATGAGPEIRFFAEVPSAGAYRLYLDFRHGDTVRTAAFTAIS